MTHRADLACGRDIVARWCNLAEKRLEYLTELFETGRWRRYHSERAFLENIREAQAAVETWRGLLTREASREEAFRENVAVDVFRFGRARAALPHDAQPRRIGPFSLQPASFPDERPRAVAPAGLEVLGVSSRVSPKQAPSMPTIDAPAFEPVLPPTFEPVFNAVPEPTRDRASAPRSDLSVMQQRYPSLRNAL